MKKESVQDEYIAVVQVVQGNPCVGGYYTNHKEHTTWKVTLLQTTLSIKTPKQIQTIVLNSQTAGVLPYEGMVLDE